MRHDGTFCTALLTSACCSRIDCSAPRGDERGEVTEKVIITAIFAALAIAAGAIIVAKVTDKANAIPTK